MPNRRWLLAVIVATLLSLCLALSAHHARGQYPVPSDCPGGICEPQPGQQQAATPYSQPPQWAQREQPPTGAQVPPVTGATSEAIVRVWAVAGNQANGGSGVLIWKDDKYGLIASCAHTFDGHGEAVTVVFKSGQVYEGRVLHLERQEDLSIIEIAAPAGVTPLKIAQEKPRIGEPMAIVGYGGGTFAVMRGHVVQFVAYANNGYNQLPDAMEVATPARQGDSGGPILNSRHEVAGIVCAAADEKANGPHCQSLRNFLARFFPRLRQRQNAPPVGAATPLPLEPLPAKPPATGTPSQPVLPNDQPHPDAAKNGEAPRWDGSNQANAPDGQAPQVETPGVESAPPGIVERAKDRVVEGAKAVALSTLEKWLLGLGPGGWAVFGAWKLYRWRKGKAAASKLPPPPPPNWLPEVSPPPPAPTCRYREPQPFPFEQTPLQRPAEPLKQRSPEALALEAENQRLHAELARKAQPVLYRQAPIGDHLPAFRRAMAIASDAQPHLRHAVKFFEDTFKVQQAGELTNA